MGRPPVDFNADKEFDADKKVHQFVTSDEPDEEERSAKRRKTEAQVKANIVEAQSRKQKQDYDRRHGAGSCYTVGAQVLKRDFTRKKRRGGKLDYRWLGSYIITVSLGKGLFRLKEANGERVSAAAFRSNSTCKDFEWYTWSVSCLCCMPVYGSS